MIRFENCHAAPVHVFHGKAVSLSLVLPDETNAPVVALYAGGKKHPMLPADGWDFDDGYTVYTATVMPPAGDVFTYHFTVNGEKSPAFSIPCLDLPAPPPLVLVTNAWWYLGECAYMEFYNPTDATVDLFDYEILIDGFALKGARMPLAAEKGTLLPPRRRAVLRHLTPLFFKRAGRTGPFDRASFLADLAARYPDTRAELCEDLLLYDIPVTDGEGKLLAGAYGELFRKYNPNVLYVVPRGQGADAAVFREDYNVTPAGPRPVRCQHAGVWYIEPIDPAVGRVQTGFAHPTPGKTPRDGVDYDATDATVPAVLQRAPTPGEVYWRDGGDVRFSFAVAAPAAGRATLCLQCGESVRTLPAHMDEEGLFTAVLPRAVAEELPEIRYWFTVQGGLFCAALGSPEKPLSLTVADKAGPLVKKTRPEQGQALLTDEPHTLTVDYVDASGVDERHSVLCLDGMAVNGAAFTQDQATFTPEKPLPVGPHCMEVTLRDKRGNRTYVKIDFTVADEHDYHLYRGQVHSHSVWSDGAGTPEEAYAYAKAAGADFFALTDHSQYLTQREYDEVIQTAARFNEPGRFAALYGFEMTWYGQCGLWGHMNVLEDPTLESDPLGTGMPELLDRTAAAPESLCMFNHPGDVWGDFGRYDSCTEAHKERVRLVEINGIQHNRSYMMILDRGWHVAPLFNEDNHEKKWTTETNATGVVMAPALTRNNILTAMRRGRTYSTQDQTLQIRYSINGALPGDTLQSPSHLTVTADLKTEDPCGIGKLELLTEYGMVVATADAGALPTYRWQVELDPDFAFYYLRVVNGKCFSVTSPIYLAGREQLALTDVTIGAAQTGKDPHTVRVCLQNKGTRTLHKVTTDLYLSSPEGFHLRELSPYLSLTTDKLTPGEARELVTTLPDVPARNRLTVVASGQAGSSRYADAAVRYVTPLLITKLLPVTSPAGEYDNPFPYVELANPGPVAVRLDGCALRFWDTYGERPQPDRTLPLAGRALPPGETMVVWMRPKNSDLTPDDFNARYGTALDEDHLMVTEQPILSPVARARRMEILYGGEVLYRVTFGGYCGGDPDMTPDVPKCYAPVEAPLPDGELLPAAVTPSVPGVPEEDCLPPRMTVTVEPEREDLPDAVTGLTHAPLAPLRAAALLAGALSAFKDIMKEK